MQRLSYYLRPWPLDGQRHSFVLSKELKSTIDGGESGILDVSVAKFGEGAALSLAQLLAAVFAFCASASTLSEYQSNQMQSFAVNTAFNGCLGRQYHHFRPPIPTSTP